MRATHISFIYGVELAGVGGGHNGYAAALHLQIARRHSRPLGRGAAGVAGFARVGGCGLVGRVGPGLLPLY